MKCNQCNLIEMAVMVRNDKEVVYQCPKCYEIAKITTEEEKMILEEEQKLKQELIEHEEERETP